MNKKKIIIFIIVGFLVIFVIAALVIRSIGLKKVNNPVPVSPVSNFQADFLSESDKKAADISTDLRIQALKRDADGEVMVYKIIRSDSDITDPAKITPSSPNLK